MTDYFTRLAKRALGAAEVIQPRQSSMFSPEEITPAVPAQVVQKRMQSASLRNKEGVDFSPESPARTPLYSGKKSKPEAASIYSQPVLSGTMEESESDSLVRTESMSTAKARSQYQGSTIRGESEEPSQGVENTPDAVKSASVSYVEAVNKQPASLPHPQFKAGDLIFNNKELGGILPEKASPDSNYARVPAVKKQNPRFPGNAFSVLGSSQARLGQLENKSSSSTAPIKITIGRVEIRGIIPTSPKQPERLPVKTRPPMSLEDYVKRRKEGPS